MKRRALLMVIYVGAVLLLVPLVPVLSLQAGSHPRPAAVARLGPDSYEILMVSHQFTPDGGIANEDRQALEAVAQEAQAAGRGRIHALVQLDTIPTQAERDALARQGLILLQYIPNYAWLAALPADNPTRVLGLSGVRWLGSLGPADKQDASLAVESSPWAYDATTGQAALYVVMHQDVGSEAADALLARYGQVKSYASGSNLYLVWMDRSQVQALLGEDLVSWVQPAEPRLEAINNVTRAWIDSDLLDGPGYGNADGTNVDMLIYDVGWVRSTHQELAGRVTQRDSGCAVADHPTHVACTTSASGVVAAATGHANNMHALLSDCMSTDTGVFYYTDPGELQGDLVYAKDTWNPAGGDADGAELFNASVGTNTSRNGWPCAWEGNYGPTDVIVDNVVRGDTAASGKFIAVWANGNERDPSTARCGTTYHTTAPPACGKNAIQVGATNKDADTMTSFSSWGPCDDGRIKPVVSAPGCAVGSNGIYSCLSGSNNSYGYLCGTSMASPATAGVLAQLIEYCRAQGLSYCPADGEFWPSSAKVLLMHAAVDLGNAGPDYQFGYGRIEADATADLLTNAPPGNYADLRQDRITNQGEIDSYQITISGSPAQLKVSLAWDDEAATMQALTKLVNDLDLEVISPGGTTYRPYVLDPSNPGNPATTGVDSLNNQEQVVVNSPANGTWTIRVVGKAVPAAPQDYSIVFPNAYSVAPGETPGATPTTTPTPNPSYCAEYIANGSFESGTTGWTLGGSAAQSNTYAHAGSYSMRAGGTSDGTFYQDVAVPADMYYGTIGFWYRMQTGEASHPWDFYDVEIRNPSTNAALTTLLSSDDSKTNATWIHATFTIGAEYAGRTVRLHFSADVDTLFDTYWYTDEVSFYLCRRAPPPTNTPTPTDTPTPTPTETSGPTPTPTPTSPPPPPETGGEQAPLCMDDPAGLLSSPGRVQQGSALAQLGQDAGSAGPVQRAAVALSMAADPREAVGDSTDAAGDVPAEELSGPAPAPAQPAAVGPIPNIKVEGLANNSGWVTAAADSQGNAYVAFEYLYASGGSCPAEGCYAVVAGKSRDNGKLWDLWYVWADTASSTRRPSIAVDSSGRLYIALELYYNSGGYRWWPARATSSCPRDVSAWGITYYTTYALNPGATAADAGGDGNDVYLVFQVPFQDDTYSDLFFVWTADGGTNWSNGYNQTTRARHHDRPTVSVGSANVSATYLRSSNNTRYFLRGAIGTVPATNVTNTANALYADADGSGAYHYVVYQRADNVYVRYSTNDGGSFSAEVAVDTTAGTQRYPDVSANGARARVAYVNGGNQTLLRTSDNSGQTWSAAYLLNMAGNSTVEGFHNVAMAFHPIGGAANGRHPLALWVDNRDSGAGQGNNIYLGTINDPPTAASLAWPANLATITAFAPSLRWTAGSDPDGDTLRYTWYVDTANPPATRVGGPIALLYSLPYYTDPATTYYWKVVADDGYQAAPDSAIWSFSSGSESFSGTPLNYTEEFAADPASWTRKGFACLDCFEADPLRWAVNPSGKWIRSGDYAWSGSSSARALYDANNADYQMASPALDLRGSAWAYFNTHYRGSSEAGYDLLYLQSRPDSATSCWTTEDSKTGNYNAGWWTYYQGAIDLTSYARTNTGQVRFRFLTNASNYGGGYGVGWYEDDVEVARESEWSWDGGGFYRLQDSEGGWFGYTNNLVDQFYSPYILLPNNPGQSIRLTLRERYNVASGDLATVWIRDCAADTWQQLLSYSGNQGSWSDRIVLLPDSYKGKQVVIALVLRSDASGTLKGPLEQGGYWDVDRLRLEGYNPTLVRISYFAAFPASRGILLAWKTETEVDNLGFHLYRSLSRDTWGSRVNESLIPAEIPGQGQGATYAFLDTSAVPGVTYYYTLVDVDFSGRETPHGPVMVALWRAYLPLLLR